MRCDKKTKQHLDAKDAMAAILGGCNGITHKEACRRIDWILASGTDEQRKSLERSMEELQNTAPSIYSRAGPEIQRQVLRLMGEKLAKQCRRAGKKPPCDDPIARSKMLRIARIFFSSKKIERVFTPLVSDYIQELEEATGEGTLKTACVKCAWWYRFAKACGLDALLLVLDIAGKLAKLGVL